MKKSPSQSSQKHHSKTIRISKIFLIAIGFATGVTIAACVTLILIFRPYRYTGKAGEIADEIYWPNEYRPGVPGLYKYELTDDGYKYWDKDYKLISDSLANQLNLQLTAGNAAISRQEYEGRKGNETVFGGVSEFFQFCGDADGSVTWDPSNIGVSIRLREDYLVSKIKKILLITGVISFIISYLSLYARKKKLRIVIS